MTDAALCRLASFWEGAAWPVLRVPCMAGLRAARAAQSLVSRVSGRAGEALWALLWHSTCRPVLQWCAARLAGVWQEHVLPVLLAASDRVRAGFEFVGRELLLPVVQLVGAGLAAGVNLLAWGLLQCVSYAYEYVALPASLWFYRVAIAPFAGVLVLAAIALVGFAVILNQLGYQPTLFILPKRRSHRHQL